jgi:hypothetical protein
MATLLDYAKAEQAALKKSRDDARAASLKAEADYAAARTKLGKATDDYAALERDAARIRKELAEVETPADGEALLAKLSDTIVALRAKSADILSAEEDAALAKASSEKAGSDLKSAESLLAAADAALSAAKSDSDRRAALVNALGDAPLATIQQDAADALKADPFKAAQNRMKDDIPDALRARAEERRQNEVDSFDLEQGIADKAESLLAAELDKNGGLSGKAEKLRAEYARAASRLRDYVGRAKERYDHALALAARVADEENDPLTDAQRARINDAKLAGDGAAAAVLEKARDDAGADVKEAEAELAKARLAARAADVDPDANPTQEVKDAQKNLDDAKNAFAIADGNYLPDSVKALDAWEAAVPDATWRHLADFEESQQALGDLKSTKGQDLVDDVTQAETALAAALADASSSARRLRTLEAERDAHAARAAFESSAASRLTLSALRGDR